MNLSTSLIHNRYDSIKLLELTTFILRQTTAVQSLFKAHCHPRYINQIDNDKFDIRLNQSFSN